MWFMYITNRDEPIFGQTSVGSINGHFLIGDSFSHFLIDCLSLSIGRKRKYFEFSNIFGCRFKICESFKYNAWYIKFIV